ncbi:N-acetylglutaminylglutamine synthetase [Permianibacter aggregans]|uniref:GNAT-family acetyltransferase (TIGR03103 family) n=1 Tax=Permianibacter aggregans TaxID=1510150 RepID=A0A4R6UGK6_9GAMM|nr:N-acetylglutaminylglutamine synthetase [Permianibacter aggregans]QGX39652.1 N-acetylglutaminylglutamine synthetase [Permianibacter aggregans]TDQ45442.1 GNAT-family acetyltransferase (TIGR03103 family) [Permianibacter aggregans]
MVITMQANQPEGYTPNALLDCGWGNLYFGQTWEDSADLALHLQKEAQGRRDIAVYVSAPQVLLAHAPQALFLDPSVFYRLPLKGKFTPTITPENFRVRPLLTRGDILAMNRLYAARGMVTVDPDAVWAKREQETFVHLLAEDQATGEILGCIMGIDHQLAFNDPERGSSFWCLAVDPQCQVPGVGKALVEAIAVEFADRDRQYLDLSVMHDNHQAIALYEKMGFHAVTGFAVKRKNAINESLYSDPERFDGLNPYSRIIINEALRRGIAVHVVDKEHNLFSLSWAGRDVLCRESLSELTSATAMMVCQNKALTCRLLQNAGLQIPAQQLYHDDKNAEEFLKIHDRIVVKPLDGEQGKGITVDVQNKSDMQAAIAKAKQFDDEVLLEAFYPGEDLRIIVINHEVVAAAIRKPAQIVGDGKHDVDALIAKQSRRREAATGGESKIPIDDETRRCVLEQGYQMDTVLETGVTLKVRKTANLHTGGTIHDVTEQLHPILKEAAILAARVLRIPVVGFDFLVTSPSSPEYVIIEANERPGLANHEPQPTAERFIDLLFPATSGEEWRYGEQERNSRAD